MNYLELKSKLMAVKHQRPRTMLCLSYCGMLLGSGVVKLKPKYFDTTDDYVLFQVIESCPRIVFKHNEPWLYDVLVSWIKKFKEPYRDLPLFPSKKWFDKSSDGRALKDMSRDFLLITPTKLAELRGQHLVDAGLSVDEVKMLYGLRPADKLVREELWNKVADASFEEVVA